MLPTSSTLALTLTEMVAPLTATLLPVPMAPTTITVLPPLAPLVPTPELVLTVPTFQVQLQTLLAHTRRISSTSLTPRSIPTWMEKPRLCRKCANLMVNYDSYDNEKRSIKVLV